MVFISGYRSNRSDFDTLDRHSEPGRPHRSRTGYQRSVGEETLGQPVPEFDSWSANLDLQLPVAVRGTIKAEAWSGANLDDYFGGIGQGIHFAEATEIEATGGWLAYEARFGSETLASMGYGLDDPKDEGLPAGARSRNQVVWANLLWDFRPALRFGVEGSWWQTAYLGGDEGSSLRLQSSLVCTFSN